MRSRTAAPNTRGFISCFVLMAVLLLGGAAAAQAALEAPFEPFDETEFFIAEGAVGTLILPAGAPDRRTSAIVVLQDGEQPDGRASRFTDQLLGAGFAVLEMVYLPGDGLERCSPPWRFTPAWRASRFASSALAQAPGWRPNGPDPWAREHCFIQAAPGWYPRRCEVSRCC